MRATFMTIFLLFAIVILQYGCSKNPKSPGDPYTGPSSEQLDILATQQQNLGNYFDQMVELVDQLDTVMALDSMMVLLVADSTIDSVYSSNDGLALRYKNGVRSLLLLKWPEPDSGQFLSNYIKEDMPADINIMPKPSIMPTSRRALFLAPVYQEFPQECDEIVDRGNQAIGTAGYGELETVYNTSCTILRFTNLSDYGIILIYSHGCAYPSWQIAPNEVYLVTGESFSRQTDSIYYSDIANDLIIPAITPTGNCYAISPRFFSQHNNFTNDKSFIYLGFCNSPWATWPTEIIDNSHALAAVGYNGTIYSWDNANWMINCLETMCNTASPEPISISEWYSHLNPNHVHVNGQQTDILRYGDTSATLWTNSPLIYFTRPMNQEVNVYVGSNIIAYFSKIMNSSTFNSSTFSINPTVAGSFFCDTLRDSTAAAFIPSSNLAHNTQYRVTISHSVKDVGGNEMESDFTWTFSTSGHGPASCASLSSGMWEFEWSYDGIVILGFEASELVQDYCWVTFDMLELFNGPLAGNYWSGTNQIEQFSFQGNFFGNPATSFSGTATTLDGSDITIDMTGSYVGGASRSSNHNNYRDRAKYGRIISSIKNSVAQSNSNNK